MRTLALVAKDVANNPIEHKSTHMAIVSRGCDTLVTAPDERPKTWNNVKNIIWKKNVFIVDREKKKSRFTYMKKTSNDFNKSKRSEQNLRWNVYYIHLLCKICLLFAKHELWMSPPCCLFIRKILQLNYYPESLRIYYTLCHHQMRFRMAHSSIK